MVRDILIVDDEVDIRMLITGILHDEGYATREAADSDSAIEAIADRRPDLVILDIWLQNSRMDGLGILNAIKREHPSVPVVVISGHGTIGTAVQAIKLGAYDFVEKPFKADRLILVVQRAVEAAKLRQENEDLSRTGREPLAVQAWVKTLVATAQLLHRWLSIVFQIFEELSYRTLTGCPHHRERPEIVPDFLSETEVPSNTSPSWF